MVDKESAIEILKHYREKPTLINEINTVEEAVWLDEALEMGIKALEQEPFMNKPCVAQQICHEDKIKVLDKIRAEIEQKCCITVGRENDPAITLYDVFEIIDKYKTGSEE